MNDASSQSAQNTLEIVYFSGHGYSIGDGRSWLLGSDTGADRTFDSIEGSSVSAGEIKSLLSKSPARTVVVFIDALLSGAISASR
jgi:hypothetical protein